MSVTASDVTVNDYDSLLRNLQRMYNERTQNGKNPIFATDAEGLWDLYLDTFDEDERQLHDCRACRSFINKYGGLVVIDNGGNQFPLFWTADGQFQPLYNRVKKASVTNVFLSTEHTWGIHRTGFTWLHLAVNHGHPYYIQPGGHRSAHAAMAEKFEDMITVKRALGDYSIDLLDNVVKLLSQDTLYRGERVKGQAEWLFKLKASIAYVKSPKKRDNIIWSAVALAPNGFCHPRSSMIGTLLDDLVAGLSFDNAAKRFKAKMHPLAYQRPQAAPFLGVVRQAENVVAELLAEGSLKRRYARFDEIETIWRERTRLSQPSHAGTGLFSNLAIAQRHITRRHVIGEMEVPRTVVTFEKFRRTVLPTADKIECQIGTGWYNFNVFLTAADADAPPILQWDIEERRNPVSTYTWTAGSQSSDMGLGMGGWINVGGVALKPYMWGNDENKFAHMSKGVIFILDGARECRNPPSGLFPEILKSGFRPIRSVIEAYSNANKLGAAQEPHACGIAITSNGNDKPVIIRVTSGGVKFTYIIERWD